MPRKNPGRSSRNKLTDVEMTNLTNELAKLSTAETAANLRRCKSRHEFAASRARTEALQRRIADLREVVRRYHALALKDNIDVSDMKLPEEAIEGNIRAAAYTLALRGSHASVRPGDPEWLILLRDEGVSDSEKEDGTNNAATSECVKEGPLARWSNCALNMS